jgi:hypothetical protein
MKVIDLFSGLNGWGDPWREAGHKVIGIDFDPQFDADVYIDIGDTQRVMDALDRFDMLQPDVVLASPPCTSFSMMSVGHHWTHDGKPKSMTAMQGERLVLATRKLISELEPRYFCIENPRARLRTMPYLLDLGRTTVWYCRYGERRAKPTDIWHNLQGIWTSRPECNNGNPDHIAAPRGSNTGTQGLGDSKTMAMIPAELSNEIREACEAAYVKQITLPPLREAVHTQ